jgi:hypothetical protein
VRQAVCWAPGCEAELVRDGSWWACPKGCRLLDMSDWMREHIAFATRAPAQVVRYFGDLP